jgi:hypothetical protein
MIRALILLVCFGLHGSAQTPLTVPFRLDVQGKPFQGRVSVRVLLKNRVVAKGSNSKSVLVFRWQPEEGASYDLDVTAGRHCVRMTSVRPGRSAWLFHHFNLHAGWKFQRVTVLAWFGLTVSFSMTRRAIHRNAS